MSREEESPAGLFRLLLGARAALNVFRTTLQVAREQAMGMDRRPELLALWLPCQRYLDGLLDALPSHLSGPVRLLRQEVEDGLLDNLPSLPALADALDALDQACESLLTDLVWRADGVDPNRCPTRNRRSDEAGF